MRKYILFLKCPIISLDKCSIISLGKCPTISLDKCSIISSLRKHLIINISFQSEKIAIDEKRRH